MPIYEYRCADCGTVFEVMQKFSDKPVGTCEKCKGKNVEKLISQSSFVLKGSGWYATENSSKEKKKEDAPVKPQCVGCPQC